MGPGSPRHDSPHGEGDPLRQRSHQLLHLLYHGSGVCAFREQGHVEGGPAWRQGGLRILLLDQGQEPAENQRHVFQGLAGPVLASWVPLAVRERGEAY